MSLEWTEEIKAVTELIQYFDILLAYQVIHLIYLNIH